MNGITNKDSIKNVMNTVNDIKESTIDFALIQSIDTTNKIFDKYKNKFGNKYYITVTHNLGPTTITITENTN